VQAWRQPVVVVVPPSVPEPSVVEGPVVVGPVVVVVGPVVVGPVVVGPVVVEGPVVVPVVELLPVDVVPVVELLPVVDVVPVVSPFTGLSFGCRGSPGSEGPLAGTRTASDVIATAAGAPETVASVDRLICWPIA
jgi:hypothetical protein